MDKRLQFYQKRIELRSGLKWEVELGSQSQKKS